MQHSNTNTNTNLEEENDKVGQTKTDKDGHPSIGFVWEHVADTHPNLEDGGEEKDRKGQKNNEDFGKQRRFGQRGLVAVEEVLNSDLKDQSEWWSW